MQVISNYLQASVNWSGEVEQLVPVLPACRDEVDWAVFWKQPHGAIYEKWAVTVGSSSFRFPFLADLWAPVHLIVFCNFSLMVSDQLKIFSFSITMYIEEPFFFSR